VVRNFNFIAGSDWHSIVTGLVTSFIVGWHKITPDVVDFSRSCFKPACEDTLGVSEAAGDISAGGVCPTASVEPSLPCRGEESSISCVGWRKGS
jgi:hypothetical protein